MAVQEEDRRNLLITLLGDVGTSYAQVRGSQLRLQIAERNIRIQQETLDLTRALAGAGQATDRDVAQAEAQLESTRATLPQLEIRDTSIHRLGVLLGSEPNSLAKELAETSNLAGRPGDGAGGPALGVTETPIGLPQS